MYNEWNAQMKIVDMLQYFDAKYPEIGKEIEEKEVLTDELKEKILTVAKEYKGEE